MPRAALTKPVVVGIGASAGGLAALKKLFELLPANSGLVFVVVVHLSPEHKSHLADLLQPSAKFPVQQVTETISLEPDHVYVIPPNANLSAIDTHLRLSQLEVIRRERAPIDHFFRTLAATHDGHSIGLILTGTGSDGTLGLREIKAKGGLILVQDPNEAEFDGMPQSAIATGLVDRVLTLAEIPDVLLRLAAMEPRLAVATEAENPALLERVLLPKIVAVLKTRTDRDFSRYKAATLLRRIARRMQLHYTDNYEEYLEKLREEPEEARALADDLLITVTSFFRDADVFKKLEQEAIPHLFDGKQPTDTLRVWSVGCATGEEAYSLAMILLEEAARRESPPKMQIFASDLHKRSLDSAREGLYPGDIQTDVSPERLKRFFQHENGGYRICKEVRDLVVFAPHNLLGDPPFSRLDLVACRNLLIYLDRSVQRDVIDLFHYALCPNGYLLLGSAETVDASELFRTDDKKLCLYRKRNVPAPEPRLPVFPLTSFRASAELVGRSETVPPSVPHQALHQNLLELYAPPSILVSPDNRVVHLSEHAGRYLIHPGGETTLNVLRLLREELRIELQGLLQSARGAKDQLDSRPVVVRFDGYAAPVVMHVRVSRDADQEGYVLVVFDEHEAKPAAKLELAAPADREVDHDLVSKRLIELEAELNVGRQRLQATIEEYETSREEMRASQEEMQSTNEELRSTLEELETSKEELQSINEELQTVNQENRHKVEELSQLSSDIQNLLTSTEIATLFLDRDLRIMRFTPRLADLFNIRMADRGRPIHDLTHRLGYDELRADAEVVLDRLVPVERETQDEARRWYLTRVLPYRSTEDRIEGVVITFVEITDRKLAEDRLTESERKYRRLFENIDQGFAEVELLRDEQGHPVDQLLLELNPAFGRLVGIPVEVARGRTALKVLPKLDDSWVATYDRVLRNGKPYRFQRHVAEIDRWYDINVMPAEGSRFVMLYDDITERKRAEATLLLSEDRQAFLLRLSDALRPLTEIDEITGTATRLLADWLGASRAYFAEWPKNADFGIVSQDYAAAGLPSLAGRYPISVFGSAHERLSRGRTWVVHDAFADTDMQPDERDYYVSRGVIAWVDVPLMVRSQLQAALCLVQNKPRVWTPHEILLADETASRCWAAMGRARAETALRKSEEKYRALFASIEQGFVLVEALQDASGNVVDYCYLETNAAVESIFGVHDITGKRLSELQPDFEQFWIDAGTAVLKSGKPFQGEEYSTRTQKWYRVHYSVVGDAANRVLGTLVEDVTERKRRESDLAFLADVSQELVRLTNVEKTMNALSEKIGAYLHLSACTLAELDDAIGTATVSYNWHKDGAPGLLGTHRQHDSPSPALVRACRAGEAIVVCDISQDETIDAAEFERLKIGSFLSFPLSRSGKRCFVLVLCRSSASEWTDEQVELARELADRIWTRLERARAEEALRLSEESQRRLLEGIPQLVWRSMDDGMWTWSSPQWEAFTGQTVEQSKARGWLEVIHPDDTSAALDAWEKARANGLLEVDYRIRQKSSGLYRYHHTRSVPIRDVRGEVIEWLGTSTDIEDLKQAEAARQSIEEQFRLFVDNVQEYGLVQTDVNGRITNWNPGAERLFGFTAAEVLGKDFTVLMTAENHASDTFAQELAYVRQGNRNEDARWFVRKNGSQFWARGMTEPIRDAAGDFRGLAKIMRDETERERAVAFTKVALAEKEELLKEVHHRVKNNLQVITSLLNLQADQIGDKQTLVAFDEARNRVASIALIHELLYRSSSLAAIHLADYAREFVPNVLNFYGLQDRVTIEVKGDGARLELDRAVPYGLLLNELLSNAMKHAFPQKRSGTIQIAFEERSDSVLLRFTDNGIGLPENFDVDKSLSLGLKLVRRLARQLRGAVHFRSTGDGTSVEVQFPVISA